MSGGGAAPEQSDAQKLSDLYASQYQGSVNQWGQNNPGIDFFPGQTYTGPNQFTQNAIQGMGNADYSDSLGYYQNVLAGDYLGLNPAMQNAVMNPALDATAGRFNAMGRYGSPSSQVNMAQAGMEALMPFYNQERLNQQNAAQMIPGLQQAQLQQQLAGGQLQEGYDQQGIDEAMARHYYDPQYEQLAQYGGLMSGSPAVSGFTEMGDGSSTAAGLGGAITGGMTGAAIGSGMTALAAPATATAAAGALSGTALAPALTALGPWGWAIGAGLGLYGALS